MEGIPQELYPSIFIHLPPKDWVTITLTSRAFHYETSRLLYRDVNLCHCSRTQIHSWADAVAYNSFLSNLVRTLRLPTVIPIKRSALVPSRQLVVALKNAFEAVVNLVSLKIRDENRKPPSKHASYLDFDLLVKLGSFRLKTFHVFGNETLCDPYEMVSFLSKQPEIEDWAQGISCPATKSAITEDMLSSSLLPHLSTFGLMCHYPCDLPLLNFATSRPLVRLAVQFDIYSETQMEDLNPLIRIMKCVHRCHETLLLFHYCDWNEESSISTPPAGQIRLIAQQLPRLKALSYSREKFWITDSHDNITELANAISKFHELKNLRMESCYGRFNKHSVRKGLVVAGQLFRCCPTLRRVCFYSNELIQGNREDASFFRLDSGEAAFNGTFGYKTWREWQDMV